MSRGQRTSAWLLRNDLNLFWLMFFVVMVGAGASGRIDDLVLGFSLSEAGGTPADAAVDMMMNAWIVLIALPFIIWLVRSIWNDRARLDGRVSGR